MAFLEITGALVLLLVSYVVYSASTHPRLGARPPPGPTPIPVLGNLHQVPAEGQHIVFTDWGKKYGPVVYAQCLSVKMVILNTLQAADDLLDKRGAIYSDRPHFGLITDVLDWKPNLPFLPYNDQWRKHRRLCQNAVGTTQSLAGFRPLHRVESLKLLMELMQTPEDFMLHIKRYPAALMLEIAYGHSVTSIDDELVVLTDEAVCEITSLGGLASTLIDFFPAVRRVLTWLPSFSVSRRVEKVRGLVQAMMNIPYEKVKQEMASGSARPSFLKTMLEEHTQAQDDMTPEQERELMCLSSIMYSAGADTTGAAMLTFMLAMTLHPEVFRKAQAEIDRVIGSSRLPDWDDRASLPYLECVLKEVYRWNPPGSLAVPHRAMTEDTYNTLHIPHGSMMIANLWGMTRDTNMYRDPDTFFPERFEQMDKVEAELKDPRKIIFGFGRRVCPGRLLGDASVWLAMASIISVFDIAKARDKDGIEISPEVAFVPGSIRRET
ncbi:uncharacterized protein FIBRA_09188 [Fibroporia radiculosa]|uniref:Cytochrome P450 n=1 Tax=Fibroporia radiculosa TaxID=599839 RepID=J7S632_9APHY|nr:uncharacterized protein FIBRA_09188 [Fibroporia radiculosa]CCM06879.1 predicted protein [Fibroporia radiculosa]